MKESDPSYVPPSFLADVKRTFQQVKQRTYHLMQLRSGDTVLDIGCGPASDTLALADLVGPAGRVVGIDRDAGMIKAANEIVESSNVSNVEHVLVDAAEMPFQDETFSACRSERVFQHLPNAARVFAEVARILKQGGRVVLADPDFSSMSASTADTELLWGMKIAMSNFLPNGYAASRNYGLVKEAQFEGATVEIVPIVFFDYEPFGVLLRARANDILSAAGFSVTRFNDFEAEARRQSTEGKFFGCINLIVTSACKPKKRAS